MSHELSPAYADAACTEIQPSGFDFGLNSPRVFVLDSGGAFSSRVVSVDTRVSDNTLSFVHGHGGPHIFKCQL